MTMKGVPISGTTKGVPISDRAEDERVLPDKPLCAVVCCSGGDQ